jgi:hypothetical protein
MLVLEGQPRGPHDTETPRAHLGDPAPGPQPRHGLELSSTTQQCFNQAIGSSGNLTKWSVQVNGNRETESIVAVSHQPNGVDLIGTMKSGSRTKVVDGQDDAKCPERPREG